MGTQQTSSCSLCGCLVPQRAGKKSHSQRRVSWASEVQLLYLLWHSVLSGPQVHTCWGQRAVRGVALARHAAGRPGEGGGKAHLLC